MDSDVVKLVKAAGAISEVRLDPSRAIREGRKRRRTRIALRGVAVTGLVAGLLVAGQIPWSRQARESAATGSGSALAGLCFDLRTLESVESIAPGGIEELRRRLDADAAALTNEGRPLLAERVSALADALAATRPLLGFQVFLTERASVDGGREAAALLGSIPWVEGTELVSGKEVLRELLAQFEDRPDVQQSLDSTKAPTAVRITVLEQRDPDAMLTELRTIDEVEFVQGPRVVLADEASRAFDAVVAPCRK